MLDCVLEHKGGLWSLESYVTESSTLGSVHDRVCLQPTTRWFVTQFGCLLPTRATLNPHALNLDFSRFLLPP